MIGIDFGGSYTDMAALHNGALKAKKSFKNKDFSLKKFQEFIEKNKIKQTSLAVTGGVKSKTFLKQLKRSKKIISVYKIAEFPAIVRGAKFLTGEKRFLLVNVGTGTPIFYADGKTFKWICGTGIGGGTLAGLSKLLIKEDIEFLEKAALRTTKTLDLKVFDIVGNTIPELDPEITASNFGKAVQESQRQKNRVARSIINMVSESIASLAGISARQCKTSTVVLTGRVIAKNSLVRKTVSKVLKKRFKIRRVIAPKNAEYATAIGAVLTANKSKKRRN